MGINIYDEFFSSDDASKDKSVFGHLKRYQRENKISRDEIRFHFQPKVFPNTLYIISLDVVSGYRSHDINFIARELNENVDNKIVLDTCLEDFPGKNFYDVMYQLASRGVPFERILVITSQKNVKNFKDEFYCPLKVIHYDMFATAYFNFANDISLWQAPRKRKLDKHLICFMKRPRLLRVIANGYLRHKGYVDQIHFSWHFSVNETRDFYDFRNTIRDLYRADPEQDMVFPDIFKDEYIEKNIYDSIDGNLEWQFDPNVVETGGVNLPMETHRKLDSAVLFDKNNKILDNSFLTEKTYKNFVYSLPFIGFGIPGYEKALNELGYQTWDHFFNTKIDESSYLTTIKSHFKLIDELCSMPLQTLEDLLNSQESIKMMEENQSTYLKQNEIKTLIERLTTDKY